MNKEKYNDWDIAKKIRCPYWEWEVCERCGNQFSIRLIQYVNEMGHFSNYCDHCKCGVVSRYGRVDLSETSFIMILGETYER